jgi:PhoPQ-activated pathogenicity-related protein
VLVVLLLLLLGLEAKLAVVLGAQSAAMLVDPSDDLLEALLDYLSAAKLDDLKDVMLGDQLVHQLANLLWGT